MNKKFFFAVAAMAAILLGPSAKAEFQIGLSLPYALDAGEIGVSAEAGYLYVSEPSQFFAGPEVFFIDLDDEQNLGIPATIDAEVLAFLFNLRYYHALDSEGRFLVYGGGGIGFSDSDITVKAGNDVGTESSSDFAFQLTAGVEYGITENVFVNGGYRYFRINGAEFFGVELDDISDHLLQGGVTFKF